jgi:hypothetical protein
MDRISLFLSASIVEIGSVLGVGIKDRPFSKIPSSISLAS